MFIGLINAGSSIVFSTLSIILSEFELLLVAQKIETSSEKFKFSNSTGRGVVENF